MSKNAKTHIRWLITRDMPNVLAIEESSFDDPWTSDIFKRCLRQRNCIGMVAEVVDTLAGFMVYELHKNRLHILDLAVHESYRRRGVGTAMLGKLVGNLSHERRNRIMLEVRETNLEAQLFFKDSGFKALSVLNDFYDDLNEAAYLMCYRYQQTPEELAHPNNRITKFGREVAS